MAEDTVEDQTEETPEDQNEDDGVADDTEEDEESGDEKDDEEDVVPVRKNVVNAQRRIITKLQKKSSEEQELSPQARALIEKELEPLKTQIGSLSDELSFRDYFRDHPEDRKFEKAARSRFEAWKDVPIEEIMKTLRPLTSESKEKAEEKAVRGRIGGASKRPQEGEGIAKTEKDFQKVYEKVKRGDRGGALKDLGITS